MYSTSIGIVIETIARMEHDEFLQASKAAEKSRLEAKQKEEMLNSNQEAEANGSDKVETEGKKPRKGIDLKKIVTSFTEFFTPDENLE